MEEEEEDVVVVVDGGTRGHGKPSILLSLSCVCLQRTSIEGGWRGTRVQDLGSRNGGERIRSGETVTEKYLG